MNNTQENKLAYDKRQALEMIKNSKYFQSINKVTVLHAKYLNCLNISDIESASKIVDQMVQVILNDK